ncbi:MarR family winged helix-turn-helix transcriptional regulator [Evansella halocellulosilytica]|uniref:MarR family winged helix-turn-helix transcriptional regulator n=1 Tax=Evansella halocellulosilytica TaxID=2011013 RepID=UPI0015C82FCD|nr:MarR family transcriptional regulator [Evansella halocellulosilytica]
MKNQTITFNCLAFQLSLARKKVLKWYEHQLEDLGLNTSYVYVMEILDEFESSNLSSIAEKLQLERATVSNLLGRMERDEFIIRLPGQERRSIEVHLTNKGKRILDEALPLLQKSDHHLNDLLDGNLERIKKAAETINQNL